MTKRPEGRQSASAQSIPFHNGNIVIEICFKCHELLPQKELFHTSQSHSHTLRKPEIHFLPAKMALGCSATCKPSSPLWHYQTLLPLSVLLMGAVLYFLYWQSPLARIWRWSWVWDSVMPVFMLAILFREAVQCWSKCADYHHALDAC